MFPIPDRSSGSGSSSGSVMVRVRPEPEGNLMQVEHPEMFYSVKFN